MATKNDLYAFLTHEGVHRGYLAIPEFHVNLPDGRLKKLDLVWAIRRGMHQYQDSSNVEYWKLIAAFEIEGCNIRNHRNGMKRHIQDFADVRNLGDEPIQKFVVLYTAAFDRAWNSDHDWDSAVAARIRWQTHGRFRIVDGRELDEAIRNIPRYPGQFG